MRIIFAWIAFSTVRHQAIGMLFGASSKFQFGDCARGTKGFTVVVRFGMRFSGDIIEGAGSTFGTSMMTVV